MPSKKAKKDPNAPKRALSSYMLFANDVRKEITTAEPTLSMEEKQPYEETAAELKSEYVVAKTKYDTDKAKTAAPKKPMSAYMHFSVGVRSEVQRENPDMAFGAVAKEISKRWNSLDAEDKGEYEDKAAEDKERYQTDLETYKLSRMGENSEDEADNADDGKKRKKKKDPNEPKRPLNAYMLFAAACRADMKAQHPTASIGEIAKEVGAKWKSLDADEKEPYETEANAAKKQYEVVIAKYRKKLAKKGGDAKPAAQKKRKVEPKKKAPAKGKKAKAAPAPVAESEDEASEEEEDDDDDDDDDDVEEDEDDDDDDDASDTD